MTGFTFYIAIGSYGGFHWGKTGVCLGWVAIRWMPLDIENVLENLIDENEELREQTR